VASRSSWSSRVIRHHRNHPANQQNGSNALEDGFHRLEDELPYSGEDSATFRTILAAGIATDALNSL